MITKDLNILGQKVPTPERPSLTILEVFKNPGVDTVNFYTTEFTSLCPVTGQPDFVTVQISYSPRKDCLESKSLKLYLQSYRNEKGFIEELCTRITRDLYHTLLPSLVSVQLESSARGGIILRACKTLEYNEKEDLG